MPYIVQVASGKFPFFNIYGDDYDTVDGTGVRNYIHVADLSEGHLAALIFLSKHKGFEVLNLGTGNGVSVLEILKAFENISGENINVQISNRRVRDVAQCFASAEKAHKELSWIAYRDIYDICEDLLRWQKIGKLG